MSDTKELFVPMKKFKCVLLIDDDPMTNFIHLKIIEKLELAETIEIATNGHLAIETIHTYYKTRKALPELILLDFKMPVMNGAEFLKFLTTLPYYNPDECKVVLLTTYLTEEESNSLKGYPVCEYLQKPLQEEGARWFFADLLPIN